MPLQVQWKLYRCKQHFEEFEKAVKAWIEGDIAHFVLTPDSDPENPTYTYASKNPPPAHLALIAGDFLQNLRSVLDYLVWQLVIANGEVPEKTRTCFPVCHSKKAFDACKTKKLRGVHPDALSIVEALQPYTERQIGEAPQPLNVLDELSNHNKHRQVLFTSLASIHKPNGSRSFSPH